MVRVLITGIGGFVGSHLAELCLGQGCQVWGTLYPGEALSNLEGFRERLQLRPCDLCQAPQVREVVAEAKPQLVFHLAAQASVPQSWRDPGGTIANNTAAQVNLLEALRGSEVKVHIAGSSEEYGAAAGEKPLDERDPLLPLTPYGLSKLTQDLLGYQYFRAYGLRVVRTRAFNHTGPRLGALYVTSNFARQIALIECGRQEPVLMVGNLEARRNYTDVRDIVRAYWLALQGGCQWGEVYNVCGEQCRSIRELLQIMLDLSEVRIDVEVDPERLRPVDLPVMDGDSQRFRHCTGWRAEIPLERTLGDLLQYWREVLRR